METLFWIQRELARYFPDADFFHGVDLNADGEIQPWEEVRDENGNGEFGDKTDWEFFYYRNEEFLKLFPGPLHWAGIFRVDNPLHDRMSLEMEVLSEGVIENGYRKLDKIAQKVLYEFGLADQNLDFTIEELIYTILTRGDVIWEGSLFSPFFAESVNLGGVTTEQGNWVTGYVEYELGQSSQVLMETIDKNLEFLRELVPTKRYLNRGEDRRALREANRLVKRYPNSAVTLTLRAEARRNLKDFDGAVGDLKKAAGIDPRYLEPFTLLLDCLLQQGKLEEAENDFWKKMKKWNYMYPDPALNWAEIFLKGGLDATALHLYESVYQTDLADTDRQKAAAGYAIARYWLQSGERYAEGDLMQYMDLAIRVEPSNAAYYQLRGNLYFQRDDFGKAAADYGKAEGLGISDLEMFYKRGQAHYKLKRYESAASDLERVVQGDPKNGEANKLLGEVQLLLHRDKDLVTTLDRQIALEPAVGGHYLQRAEAKARLGDCDGASEVEIVIQDPSISQFHRLLGDCYLQKGEMEKAAGSFSRGLSANPQDRKLFLSHGEVRLRQKKYREAIHDFESVIALSAGAKDKLEKDARVLRLEAAKKMILGEDQ